MSLSVWAGDLSAGPDYDRLVKWLSSAYMLGSLLTGPMPGMLADRFGSYVPAYLLFLASLVCSMALIQGVYYKLGLGNVPQNPDRSSGPHGPLFYGFLANFPQDNGGGRPPRSGIRTSPAWGS